MTATLPPAIVIATRGSELALWQAHHTRDRLMATQPGLEVSLQIIKTQGDKILDVPLSKVGGKALFVKEIEQALIDGTAHVAVHSMKDVPADLADGLVLSAVTAREVPFDALCTRDGSNLASLPRGAKVGTSSLRRQCQLLAARPDLNIAMLRGNVPTRLRKLDEGEFDAIVLAAAGLIRLGHGHRISERLVPPLCLPAVGQGVLGIETRADAPAVAALVKKAMHDGVQADAIGAERSFLSRMGGSCQTPLGAYATIEGDTLTLDSLCGTPDGKTILRDHRVGPRSEAVALGCAAADALLAQGGDVIVAACTQAANL